ncbi:MAG TPA: serine hydrolase [Chitinophagaceae bacterium]|nr:serine hydrolase [Chitinophagaceae bacterium]
MRNISLLLLLIAVTGIATAQKKAVPAQIDKRFEGLDTAFARILKDWHAVGFAVAVVEKNKVIYAKGFGYRDVENKKPVTANTLFAIGSCTKAFTASLLGMLREKGKVDFNKPIRNYLPELKFYNDNMNNNILVKDLMSHRTGLPRHDLSWYYFTTKSRDSLIQRIQYMEPTYGVREKWQYNNFMFLVQGVLVQKLTGELWEKNVKEKILQPLGMERTDFSVDTMAADSDAAIGYYVKKDSIIHKLDYYHIDAMGPAGSINSSVTEMAKWVITWINDGKFGEKQIIPAGYATEAMSPQMMIDGGLPTKEIPDVFFSSYGYGWMQASYKGHYRVEHGGNIDGFSASTCFFPSDSIGIIVLSNQNGSTVPSAVRNLIADRMLGLKYYDWETYLKSRADSAKAAAKKAEAAQVSSRKLNTVPSHPLKDYEGIYTNKGYGAINVSLERDSLFAFLPNAKWWLMHYHYDMFEPFDDNIHDGIDTSDKSDPLQFNMNMAGDIESLSITMEGGLKPIVFDRSPKPKEISKDSLQKYTGEYGLGPVTAKLYIKDDKTLYLFVPGQPEYALVPVDTNKFSIKTLTGYTLQFNADDKGNITEVLFIQPNGTFKATKKK